MLKKIQSAIYRWDCSHCNMPNYFTDEALGIFSCYYCKRYICQQDDVENPQHVVGVSEPPIDKDILEHILCRNETHSADTISIKELKKYIEHANKAAKRGVAYVDIPVKYMIIISLLFPNHKFTQVDRGSIDPPRLPKLHADFIEITLDK